MAEIVEAGERIVNVWWDFHYGRLSIFDDLDAPLLPIKRDMKIIVPLAFSSPKDHLKRQEGFCIHSRFHTIAHGEKLGEVRV